MELIGILVVLRRRWALVALGALIALAAGILATHRVSIAPPQLHSRTSETGVARVEVLVDTPRPLLAAARSAGDETIATRALLLGSLLERDEARRAIARGAGLKEAKLAIANPFLSTPIETPLSRAAAEVIRPSEPNVLTVSPGDPRVPIISMVAEAPDPGAAKRIAKAATAELGLLTRGPEPAGKHPVELQQLGPVEVEGVVSGPSRITAAIAAAVIFALWCAAIVVLDRVARRSRSDPGRVLAHPAPPRPPRAPAAAGPARNGAAPDHAGQA